MNLAHEKCARARMKRENNEEAMQKSSAGLQYQ